MSGAPPGYNPSDSLLSGGTSAQIHPVMGGGGAMPEGHNAGVSLLQGGEGAQIHPVMGGGAPGDATAPAVAVPDVPALAAAAEDGASAAVAAAVTTPAALPPIPFDQLPNRIKSVENEIAGLAATVASPSLSAVHKREYELQLENKRAELAKLKGIQDDEIERREKQKARIDLNKLKGTESWVEIYKLEVDPTKVLTQPIYKEEEVNIANRTSAEFKELVANYSTAQKEVWVKKLVDEKTGSAGIATVTGERCITTGTVVTASTMFDRLIHLLPETTQVLLIAPPIQGNLTLFNTVIDSLVKYGYLTQTIDGNMALRSNCELVFSAPIFGMLTIAKYDDEEDMVKNNSLIWYSILRLKLLAKGRVTALSDYRDATEKIGCFLHQRLQTSGPLGSPSVPLNEEISNLLEPSYVIYPFSRGEKDGVLVTAALNGEAALPMPKEGQKTYSVGQALKLPSFTDAYIAIRPELGKADSEFGNYVTFKSFGAGDTVADMGGFKPQKSTRGDCQDLIYLQRLEKMQPETRLGPLSGMGGTIDGKFPLTIVRLRPDPQGLTGFEPSCARIGDSLRSVSMARLEQFVPSPMEVPRDQAFTMVNLGPKVYELRILPPGSLDWQQLRFTDSEAEFLNDLNLRPFILSDVFPIKSLGMRDGRDSRDWRNWVSHFLKAVTNSQCFKDTNLLSRRECEDARIFINAVYDYFLLNDDRLAAAFNTEDEALQNAEMFLRETRTRAELRRLEDANKQAAVIRKEEDKDPSIGERDNKTIVNMDDGIFTRKKMWGDAQPDPEAYEGGPGGEDYLTIPLLIVNRRTGVYQLRGLRVEKRLDEAPKEALTRLNELGEHLKVKYPGWNFFY